jgi:hypothetical protein
VPAHVGDLERRRRPHPAEPHSRPAGLLTQPRRRIVERRPRRKCRRPPTIQPDGTRIAPTPRAAPLRDPPEWPATPV